MIPQAVTDALNALQGAKDDVEAAIAAKQQTAATLNQAQSADAAAGQDVSDKTAILNQKRVQLEAIEDSYYQPGAQPPA